MKQNQIEISKKFGALENLNDSKVINRAAVRSQPVHCTAAHRG
jgi:hypothetical protein